MDFASHAETSETNKKDRPDNDGCYLLIIILIQKFKNFSKIHTELLLIILESWTLSKPLKCFSWCFNVMEPEHTTFDFYYQPLKSFNILSMRILFDLRSMVQCHNLKFLFITTL